ncbi:MAG: Signal peptidase-like protein [Bacteriodetes bacterium]|nr:Signal peptidase-like protein [Bacteroidota bacterium]
MNNIIEGFGNSSESSIDDTVNGFTVTNELQVLEETYTNQKSCGCGGGGCCGKKRTTQSRPVAEYLSRTEGAIVPNFVEVEFKGRRREIFLNKKKLAFTLYDAVIVETHQGEHFGTVAAFGLLNEKILNKVNSESQPAYSVLRLASDAEVKQNEINTAEEHSIIQYGRTTAHEFGHDIKITDAEWQLDKKQLTIYFTAPQRIDFRELVKNFARMYKTRIELRQISGRDEATRLGGIGTCGKLLCCTQFKPSTAHVTLDHARTQQLSTSNISKLTGMCGRLKCCLMFEIENYESVPEHAVSL